MGGYLTPVAGFVHGGLSSGQPELNSHSLPRFLTHSLTPQLPQSPTHSLTRPLPQANQNWTIDKKVETFFAVELPAAVAITHYTLRHGDKEDLSYSLRNWVLQGSAGGKVRCTSCTSSVF